MGLSRAIILIVIVSSLIISAIFSIQSFTGYIITDKVSNSLNLSAILFFLIGIIGAFVYTIKFKNSGLLEHQ